MLVVFLKNILVNIHGQKKKSDCVRRHTLAWSINHSSLMEINSGTPKLATKILTGCWCMNLAMSGGLTKLPIAIGLTCGYKKAFAVLLMHSIFAKQAENKST